MSGRFQLIGMHIKLAMEGLKGITISSTEKGFIVSVIKSKWNKVTGRKLSSLRKVLCESETGHIVKSGRIVAL